MLTEVVWPLRPPNRRIRQSDGYTLFSSLCRSGLVFHGEPDTQVLLRKSEFVMRVQEPRAWRLAGSGLQSLPLGCDLLRLGPPLVRPLVPATRLWSALVTIKPYLTPESFAEALRRQMAHLEINAAIRLGPRGITRVAGAAVVGFGVELDGLSARDSLVVQSRGFGGKQRMGCGVFVPC